MVSAINFAVRTSAGTTQLGSVAGDGQSNLIAVQAGQSISLNLSPGSVVAYKQQGSDLVVQLTDGRTIVLSNYFATPDGMANKLYLSSNDEIVEVRVANGVDGVLFADYGPTQAMEKWSPLDNLRFSESDVLSDVQLASNEPAGMAMLVPGLLAGGGTAAGLGGLGTAAALAGGALLLGGAGGGGTSTGSTSTDTAGTSTSTGTGGTGTSTGGTGTGGGTTTTTTHTPPAVDPRAPTTISTTTNNPSLVVTGTGHPGDAVAVTVGGVTTTTTITGGGTWTVTLAGPTLPPDGTYVPTVVVTNTVTGTTTTLTGSTYVIDMTPPAFVVQDGTSSVGDVHNIATYAATGGMTVLSGTGEAGATMRVTANGHTLTAVVAANGTWSVSFTQAQLPGGEYRQVPVQITATDVNGNVSTAYNSMIAIDTVANPIAVTAVAGDGTVNMVESQNGFLISGTSIAGAQLTVTIGTSTQTVTVGANGQWSANFAGGIATQNGMATVTLSSVDAAGNPSAHSHQFRVDTVATAVVSANQTHGASISAAEAAAGVNITGTADANSSVVVKFEGQSRTVTADANGNWTANFSLSHLVGAGAVERTGTVTVTATDPYGNVANTTQSVTIDTLAPNDPLVLQDTGTEGLISGITTATAPGDYTYHVVGSTGLSQQLNVSPTQTWNHTREDGLLVPSETVSFATNVPNGSYLVIRDVDAAGNESSTLHLRSTTEVTVDLNRVGLQAFDFGTINLLSADAKLNLSTATVVAMTGADKQMTVTGNSDDVVNLFGVTSVGGLSTSNGETYRLYTLGSGASVLIDDDITVNTQLP